MSQEDIGIPNHSCQKYLVYESIGEDRKNMRIVYGDDIFQVLQEANLNDQPIVVSKIGKCVIDWS